MTNQHSQNVEIVLSILQDEANGDVKKALEKLTEDYSMTWVYKKESGELFPVTGKGVEEELEEVYPIRNRKYVIKNIAEGKNLVMLELVESYPDPKTGEVYRTPMVLVLEMKDGKIRTGRHYCDPKISFELLPEEEISKAYKNPQSESFEITDQRSQ